MSRLLKQLSTVPAVSTTHTHALAHPRVKQHTTDLQCPLMHYKIEWFIADVWVPKLIGFIYKINSIE